MKMGLVLVEGGGRVIHGGRARNNQADPALRTAAK